MSTPATTWTDEAREAVQTALLSARYPDGEYVSTVSRRTADDYLAPAVLDALAPFVAAREAAAREEGRAERQGTHQLCTAGQQNGLSHVTCTCGERFEHHEWEVALGIWATHFTDRVLGADPTA